MRVRRGFKYRLEPTSEQGALCEAFAGSCRFVWNWFLDQRSSLYQACGRSAGYVFQANQLPALKKHFRWLAESPHHCLQQTLRDLDKAFQAFFGGRARYPRFKAKGRCVDSFRFPDPKQFSAESGRIRLPKLGWVRMRMSKAERRGLPRFAGADLKQATVVREGEHWYVCLSCEIELPKAGAAPVSEAGIDLGTKALAVLSDGSRFEASPAFSKLSGRLRRAQRSLSRKVRGSANYWKAKSRVSRLHGRIARTRLDALHKITTAIGKSHALVAIEDLDVKGMGASASGTVESPGRDVRAKSGLNRSIADSSWATFARLLEYKLKASGGRLVRVHPAYTSQKCSACGTVDRQSRVSRDDYRCRCCGAESDADLNAARNILAAGRAAQALGDIRPVAA